MVIIIIIIQLNMAGQTNQGIITSAIKHTNDNLNPLIDILCLKTITNSNIV